MDSKFQILNSNEKGIILPDNVYSLVLNIPSSFSIMEKEPFKSKGPQYYYDAIVQFFFNINDPIIQLYPGAEHIIPEPSSTYYSVLCHGKGTLTFTDANVRELDQFMLLDGLVWGTYPGPTPTGTGIITETGPGITTQTGPGITTKTDSGIISSVNSQPSERIPEYTTTDNSDNKRKTTIIVVSIVVPVVVIAVVGILIFIILNYSVFKIRYYIIDNK